MADLENYLLSLSEVVFSRFFEDGYASLSRPEQVFICEWGLESEINNSGFSGYFFNSSSDQITQTVAALEEIGAHHTAELVKQASAVFPDSQPPADQGERQELLLSLGEAAERTLDELDSLFYEYRDDLSILLYAYVQKHRTEIRGT